MKKILLLALSAGFLFSSCNDDDDDNNELNIIGVWKHSQMKVFSGKNGGVLTENSYNSCDQKSTTEFTTLGIAKSDYYESNNGTCNHYPEEFGYSYNKYSQKLIVDGNIFSIKSYTDNELVLDNPDINEDFNNDGYNDIYELHLTR